MRGFLGNPRRVLIVVHDLVVTVLAMLATLYIRFGDGQNGGLEIRYPWLLAILPCYVAYAGLIYWYFHLYMAKWRFAARPAKYFPRGHGIGDFAARARLRAVVSNAIWDFLLRQNHHRTLLVLADVLLGRSSDRLSAIQALAHATARQRSRCHADPDCRSGRGRRSSAARNRERCGKERPAGRNSFTVFGRPIPLGPRCAGAGVAHRSGVGRGWLEVAGHPRQSVGSHTERSRTRAASGNHADARAAAGPSRQPHAFAWRRRGGAAPYADQCRGFVVAAKRKNRLSPPRTFHSRQIDRGHRRRRLDWLRNLRSRRKFWRRKAARSREFRARIARNSGADGS